MSSNIARSKLRKRLLGLSITTALIAILCAICIAVVAFIALRILVVVMGMIGLASAGPHAATDALNNGDSVTRLTVLTQLHETLDAQPSLTFDSQTTALILPAIERCKTDADADVVSLAEQLENDVKGRTQP